jgi:tetratricopeptide (TPR) repeat protein
LRREIQARNNQQGRNWNQIIQFRFLAYNFVMARALVMLLSWALIGYAESPALASLGKGNGLMQAERYKEAETLFLQALQSDKSLEEARKNLAICEFEQREYDAARRDFQALATGKSAVLARYYLGRLDLLDGNFDSALSRLRFAGARGAPFDQDFFLGVADYRKGSIKEAIAVWRRYLKVNPRDFRAHEWLARALAKTGARDEANLEYGRTRELHEYYAQGSVMLRQCSAMINEQRADEAWQVCGPMLETDDADKAAALGMLFGQAGDHQHALAFWDKAVTLDPESPEANYNLALAYFQLQAIPRAKPYAKTARDLWPQFPEANILYGTILYMLAEDREAIEVLNAAHSLRPDDENVKKLLVELRSHPPHPQN